MKTLNYFFSFHSQFRLVYPKILVRSLLFVFCYSIIPNLQAQDCFPDVEPPVLICKKIDTLNLGWCGNEQVYAWEFVKYTVDNCSKNVKITFDREGKLEWIESFYLLIGLDTSNNFITIYAHDNAANVSECSSYCLPVTTLDYKVPCKLLADGAYSDELNKLKMDVKTEDNNVHPTNLLTIYSPLDFRTSISNISMVKSLVLSTLDIPFDLWFITTFDLVETERMIIGTNRYQSSMNFLSADTNCDGEINILDIYKSYQYITGQIDRDNCIAQPLLRFLNDSGEIVGSEINYKLNQNEIPNIGFCQRGDISREVTFPNSHFTNPVSRISGAPVYWKTKDLFLVKDQIYTVEFKLSDSMNLFGFQCNFKFDSNLIQLQNQFANFISSSYHKYSDDLQWVWRNSSNPKLENDFPVISFQIQAKADGMLSDAFSLNKQSITNMLVDGTGNAYPIEIKFTNIKEYPYKESAKIDLSIFTGPSTQMVWLKGSMVPFENGILRILSMDGKEFSTKRIDSSTGLINELIELPKNRHLLVQLRLPNGHTKVIRY